MVLSRQTISDIFSLAKFSNVKATAAEILIG